MDYIFNHGCTHNIFCPTLDVCPKKSYRVGDSCLQIITEIPLSYHDAVYYCQGYYIKNCYCHFTQLYFCSEDQGGSLYEPRDESLDENVMFINVMTAWIGVRNPDNTERQNAEYSFSEPLPMLNIFSWTYESDPDSTLVFTKWSTDQDLTINIEAVSGLHDIFNCKRFSTNFSFVATSSSVYQDNPTKYGPLVAIDGLVQNNNNVFISKNEKKPWIQLDFGRQVQVHSVEVTNRKDSSGERFKNVRFHVSDYAATGNGEDIGENCAKFIGPSSTGAVETITCDRPKWGRYLSIQLKDTQYLQINEIKVKSKFTSKS